MKTMNGWRRVCKSEPCKVCGKPDWCSESADGAVALCQRVESPKRVGDAGWLHRLVDRPWQSSRRVVKTIRLREAAPSCNDMATIAARYSSALTPERLRWLSEKLTLTTASLTRLGVGWSAAHTAFTFPMTDAAAHVRGVRLRFPDGRKLAIKGGREGLFIPSGFQGGGRMLISEGPTDCAALLDLGFDAIGRPSCMGGVRLIVELVKQHKPREVVIVADGDVPGQRGADALAFLLLAYVKSVRVIQPPTGIKDARDWKRAGATQQDIEQTINNAPVHRLTVRAKRVGA